MATEATPVYSKDAQAAARGPKNADLDGATDAAIANVAEQVANVARRVTLPGADATWPKSSTRIVVKDESGSKASINIVAPWAGGAEWGAKVHTVWGNRVFIHRFPALHKVWAVHVSVGGTKTGHILGAAWELFEKKADDDMADDMADEIDDSLTKAGLPA